jgi:hypothetical protein
MTAPSLLFPFYNHSALRDRTFSVGLIPAPGNAADTVASGSKKVIEGCAMYRYPTEQLMTVEEAERLSELHTGRKRQPRQPSLWAWQSVSGALEPTVTEAQVDSISGCPRLLPR